MSENRYLKAAVVQETCVCAYKIQTPTHNISNIQEAEGS